MVPIDIENSTRAASCSKGSAEMPSQPCHPRVLEIDSSEDESLDLDEAARDNGYECGSMDHIQSLHEKLAARQRELSKAHQKHESEERRQKLQKGLANLRDELRESRALENLQEVSNLSLITNPIKL